MRLAEVQYRDAINLFLGRCLDKRKLIKAANPDVVQIACGYQMVRITGSSS